jgi:AraC family transcriptional regulator
MEWLKKLGAAIDYIEDNLDKEISYDEAARIACCSPYYFQRIFSYVSGVSLSEYIRRRKMTQAAFELQRTDEKAMGSILQAYPSIQFRIEITGGSAMVYHITENSPCILWE